MHRFASFDRLPRNLWREWCPILGSVARKHSMHSPNGLMETKDTDEAVVDVAGQREATMA